MKLALASGTGVEVTMYESKPFFRIQRNPKEHTQGRVLAPEE